MDTESVQPFDLKTAWPPRRCETIQEYLQAAYGKWDQTGHTHAFRGVTKRFPNLRPSFDRRDITDDDPVNIETQLLEEFLLRARNDLTPQEQRRYLLAEARWGNRRNTGTLVVARHRMVPTRCLDWSDCLLRSLFFACVADCEGEGEVWWFDRCEFDCRVAAQWPRLFRKHEHVEAEIEQEFIKGHNGAWFTALGYELLPGDRPHRQEAWITVAGQLGACHAEEIHRLGVCEKGRLVLPAELKPEALRLLEQLDITKESLGFSPDHPADKIAKDITEEFEKDYPLKNCATLCKEDA